MMKIVIRTKSYSTFRKDKFKQVEKGVEDGKRKRNEQQKWLKPRPGKKAKAILAIIMPYMSETQSMGYEE